MIFAAFFAVMLLLSGLLTCFYLWFHPWELFGMTEDEYKCFEREDNKNE